MVRKALLMILDGWGIGSKGKGDVINNIPTLYLDYLNVTCSHSQLQASGENVGLPDGQMGNSEVGHLNIGTGRVIYRDLVRISRACKDGSALQNPEIASTYTYARKTGKKLHSVGLTSSGGVYSSLDHLYRLLIISKECGPKNTHVHCFMSGRDTDPKNGVGFIEALQHVCEANDAHIASIIRRFYATNRGKRWNRAKKAYDLLVNGVSKKTTNMVQVICESYVEDVTGGSIKPITNAAVQGQIGGGDVVIFFNFRNDRAKELTQVLTQTDTPDEGMHIIKDLQYYTMTPYDANFKNIHVPFPKENVEMTLGEYLSNLGKKQLYITETEEYAHVTFFSNGGREEPYKREDCILANLPKAVTYDSKPKMGAHEVEDKLADIVGIQQYDFTVVNFANSSMVGHTGIYNAIAKAAWAIDHCVKEVIEAAKANDHEVIIIADHGNADNAIDEDGAPSTAYSLNLISFIYVTNNNSATVKDGRSADVASSILHIMGLEQPEATTDENLIVD